MTFISYFIMLYGLRFAIKNILFIRPLWSILFQINKFGTGFRRKDRKYMCGGIRLMFEKIFALYMTGTGNSYKVAIWFSEIAQELGLPINIQQIKTDKLCIRPDANTLCVFTFPTHGFTAPWLVLKQILQLPRANGAAAVVLPSRAGTRIKGISFPGLEGTAG